MKQKKITVLQLVSYAAGRQGRRGVGGPERRALESLNRFDPDRVHLVVCYSSEGRLWREFERAAQRLEHVDLVDFACRGRRDVRAFSVIRRLIREHDIDVVHTQGPHGADWWASAAAYATGRAAIITRPVTNESYHLRPFDAWRFARLDRLALSRAHVVVFVSRSTLAEAIASKLGWCRGARTVVVPNGVDTSRFHPGPRARHQRPARGGAPALGMVAQLLPVKNWDGFLDLTEHVVSRVAGAQALVVGDGPERHRLASEVRRRGLQRSVRFLGHQHDVAPVLRDLDVFVLCSHREGLPVAMLEAMASGLPSVVTAVGASSEVVVNGRTGFVVPAGDMRGAADHVVKLLCSPRLRAAMGAAAVARVRKHYTLEQMVQRYQQLYEEAAAARRFAGGSVRGAAKRLRDRGTRRQGRRGAASRRRRTGQPV